MALQYLIRNYFGVENVIAVRLAKSMHDLPTYPRADSCALVYYDNDMAPGFHYYESNGTALNVNDIANSARARIIQCSQAGSDEDLSRFEELAGPAIECDNRPEAPRREETQSADDGRLSTIPEGGEEEEGR